MKTVRHIGVLDDEIIAVRGMGFLDIEMPHAIGLDVAKRIQPDVGNIVSVTAHSHYSLEAFKTVVDYILNQNTQSVYSKPWQKWNLLFL